MTLLRNPAVRTDRIQVERYLPAMKQDWDRFIENSKNGTFLLRRDYMDYHSDRFCDHSLMISAGNKLVSVLPANSADRVLHSHGGLTYGGLVLGFDMKTPSLLRVFDAVARHLVQAGFKKLLYKAIPHIYHKVPSEEDLYALFVSKARLVRREVSSTISLGKSRLPAKRLNGARKAAKLGVVVHRSQGFSAFFDMVNVRLEDKYRVRAVHTAAEMQLLAQRFPENIKLFMAVLAGETVGGALVYESRETVHLQYLSATDRGRQVRALDLLVLFLLEQYQGKKRWFDFGISTESAGSYLNESLIRQKEEFGASAVNYDTYELELC